MQHRRFCTQRGLVLHERAQHGVEGLVARDADPPGERVGRPDHVLLGPQEDVLPSPLKRVADRRSHSSLLGDLSDI